MAAYTNSSTVRSYLGITSTSDDTLLTALILRAQTAIDAYTHRTFSSTANTTRRFTVGRDTDKRTLWLDADLASINAVVTSADSTSPVTVASTEYITHPRNTKPYYAIELRSDADADWDYADAPEMGVTVSGKWAYSTSPPADVVHACIRLASYYYRQRDAQVFDVTADPGSGTITVPVGIPADVKMVLKPYVRTELSVAFGDD